MSKLTVFNKIGFHAGPGGNATGIGDYMRKLDAAGIPFVMKSVDHYGFIFEAAQFANAPHVFCYRLSAFGQPGDYNFDVPDYALDPEEAAAKHWLHMKKHLPPEFDREKVWIEPINEVDKGRSDWLGHFAAEFGGIALREGLKVMQFAWSSGEPEQDQWELPGMLRYLQLCAEHPDRLGIALHEYSYDKNDIWRLKGDLVGRFRQLFEVCDRHGIRRPKLIMSEWGWTHNRVPDPTTALIHIEEVNRLYARYPEILGGAIWFLGPGFENIANQAQRLIQPVTDFSLRWRLEVEPDLPRPITPPPPAGGPEGAQLRVQPPGPDPAAEPVKPPPAKPSNATFVADLTIPDDAEVTAGSSFTKRWRVKNTGQTTWDGGYKLVFVGGDPMGDLMAVDVPVCPPGQTVDISLSLRAPRQKEGTVYGDWRMTAPEGHQFGDILYLRITVTPPAPAAGVGAAAFVADVTIPDDTIVEPGSPFTKTWKIKNTGTRPWGSGDRLAFVGGATLSSVQSVPLPAAQSGQVVEVSVPMRAPIVPGTHWADWRPQDGQGDFFGEILFVRIVVPEPAGTGGRIDPISQNDPRWKEVRLGDSFSDLTIGDWGCLLTCFTMTANAFGKELSPADLNDRMLRKQLFLDHKLTPWNALANLYSDIIYEGRLEARNTPNLTERIDAALKAGHPVAVQVDYTPESPYTPNDQHWVLVVGREGNDYRINDPWIFPSVETSMRMRYGRPGKLLRDSIVSAIFYRSTRSQTALPVVGTGVLSAAAGAPKAVNLLQVGMNIDPILPHSNPHKSGDFKGLNWVRFVYKIAAHPDPRRRNLRAAFGVYDETVRDYQRQGIGSIIVLNQETVWGGAPWAGDGDWRTYSANLAQVAGQIARHYARYENSIAYEIWHKEDMTGDPAAIHVPAEGYDRLLQKVSDAIRKAAPKAQILVGGLVTNEETAAAYLAGVREKLGGILPVDGIAVHPYGRWGTRAPFNWGEMFRPIGDLVRRYRRDFPEIPLWITEVGVAGSDPIDAAFWPEIAEYMADLFQHVNERHTDEIPVVVWYAWSDLMNQAGVVDVGGRPKGRLYDTFRKIRNKEV